MKNKGVIFIVIIICALAIAGICYLNNGTTHMKDEEKAMKEPAEDYFNKYISANDSTTTYDITLQMLEDANKNGENYNLKSLEKCNKTKTIARVTINFQNGKPKKTEIILNC